MKISQLRFYGGARQRTCRLGLADIFLEVQEILLSAQVAVKEETQANGAAVIRELLDAEFKKRADWKGNKTGDIDWIKRFRYNSTLIARLGVEVQISARSDLLIRDIIHLRNKLQAGDIDVGVIVVPDDRLQRFLTDRTPSFSEAVKYMEVEFPEAKTYDIVLIAVEHDATSDTPLPKKRTNRGRKPTEE